MILTVGVGLLLFASACYYYTNEPFVVVGDSMYPTYYNDEVVNVNKLDKQNVRKGDVVVAKLKQDDKKRYVIKRISNIRIRPEDGELEYFLLGDNREVSLDSRYYGYVHYKQIVGKVVQQREKRED